MDKQKGREFFLVYRESGWTSDEIDQLAVLYGKYKKTVETVPDQPKLLFVDDAFSECAVRFLFKCVLETDDFLFLRSVPDGSENGEFVGTLICTRDFMNFTRHDFTGDKELTLLNTSSEYIRKLLNTHKLKLEKV